MLVQISWECTPPYLSTGISNILQPAQAEVVLGQLSTYLASWAVSLIFQATRGTEGLLSNMDSWKRQSQHQTCFCLRVRVNRICTCTSTVTMASDNEQADKQTKTFIYVILRQQWFICNVVKMAFIMETGNKNGYCALFQIVKRGHVRVKKFVIETLRRH